ncbi:AAA family ATPase [Caballeronia sp. GAWG1-1]|uniref:AAA family ATPase n=1 Tax=Caballeronia sp. GAWG1-1 TaxID=2921742 RepID=UPI0032EEE24A
MRGPPQFVTLNPVQFPELTKLRNEVRDTLRKTVVSNVIDELAANSDVSAWVRHGLALHTQNGDAATCKFCKQPLPEVRLRRLEAHINDEFRRFSQELQQVYDRIRTAATNFPTSRSSIRTVCIRSFERNSTKHAGHFS